MSNRLLNNARTMHEALLKAAELIQRYGGVSHDRLSEILVAAVTDGEFVGKNNKGSDVLSQKYGKIEVKSRILGTDGPYPRVTLKPNNIEKADYFVGVRWTPEINLWAAWMLPKTSAAELYEEMCQHGGQAHISWSKWSSCQEAIDLFTPMKEILSAGLSSPS